MYLRKLIVDLQVVLSRRYSVQNLVYRVNRQQNQDNMQVMMLNDEDRYHSMMGSFPPWTELEVDFITFNEDQQTIKCIFKE
jgi:hypothetical protein